MSSSPPDPRDASLDELLAQRQWARRLARSLVGDELRADDLTQDAFAIALERSRDEVRDWRSWLAVTIRRLASRARRGDARRREWEQRAARGEADVSDELAVRRAELQQELARAVLALAEPHRTTILLRYLEELDVDEIARRMNVPPATVRTRTARGLELLRAHLAARSGRDGTPLAELLVLGGAAGLAGEAHAAHSSASAAPSALRPASRRSAGVLRLAGACAVLAALALFVTYGGRTPPDAGAPELAARANAPAPPDDARALERDRIPRAANAPHAATIPPPAAGATSDDRPLEDGSARITGRIVTPTGASIAGARVFLFGVPLLRAFQDLPDELAPVAEVATDAHGAFTFEGVAAERTYGLVAEAPGHAAASRNAQAGDLRAWTLPRAARVEGRVLDAATRRPRAGVELRFPVQCVEGGHLVRSRVVTVDADGRFVLPGVPVLSELAVEVGAPDVLGCTTTLAAGSSGRVEQDIFVPAEAEYRGTVVDGESGATIAGATIRTPYSAKPLAVTDEHGRFRLRALRSADDDAPRAASAHETLRFITNTSATNSTQLVIEAPGFCLGNSHLAGARRDARGELVVPLLRGGRITGRIVDAAGTPVAGATITWGEKPPLRLLDGAAARPARAAECATSDARGEFQLAPVPVACDGTLWIRRGSGAPLELDDVVPSEPGATRELVVPIDDVATLHGRVRFNGRPHDAYVWLLRPDGRRGAFRRADERGEFAFEVLAAGEHVLRACTADGTSTCSADQRVTLAAGTTGTLELDITGERVYVGGSVRAPDGTPAQGIALVAYLSRNSSAFVDRRQEVGHAVTRADGRFEIGVPANRQGRTFEVALEHGATRFVVRDVECGRDDLRFELPELVSLQLVVAARADGAPVDHIAVAWIDPATGVERALHAGRELPAAGGRLEVQVPRGPVELVVSAPSLGFAPARVRYAGAGADAATIDELHVQLQR